MFFLKKPFLFLVNEFKDGKTDKVARVNPNKVLGAKFAKDKHILITCRSLVSLAPGKQGTFILVL